MTRASLQAAAIATFVSLALAATAAAQHAPRELLPEQQVQHALNRLAFGPRPGDAAQVRAMGVDAWIEQQLHPERIDDRRAVDLLAGYPGLTARTADVVDAYRRIQRAQRTVQASQADSMAPGDLRRAALAADPMVADAQRLTASAVQDLMTAKLVRAVASERQLYEVMVDFWSNHFSVFVGKGQVRLYLAEYDRDVIRPNAMGKFRDLLGAVAKSPAMLFYLDNFQSQADSMHPTLAQLQASRAMGPRGGRGGQAGGAGGATPAQLQRFCDGPRGDLPPRLGQIAPEVRRMLSAGSASECVQLLASLQQRTQQLQQQRGRRGLNENYARELMELHTLGVDGGYTQKDVIEVARALTGWSLDLQRGAFVFNPAMHDAAEKTVLGRTLPGGRGMQDGEDVLDIVARHPATARFISTKLARRFISDAPPQAVVDRCAAVFTKSDGDIRETVACVVRSPEFFAPSAYRAKVKTPFEAVASALRATNSEIGPRPGAPQAVAQLGQPLYGRQTPDGWPDVAEEWMNTGAILGRINFGVALAANRVPGVVRGNVLELESVRSASRQQQVDAVIRALLGGEVSPETRQILVSGENPFATSSSTGAMVDTSATMTGGTMQARRNADAPPVRVLQGRGGRGGRADLAPVGLDGLNQVIGLALGAPEFQRR